MPRRTPGTLLPIEVDILEVGARLTDEGERFHGFGLAERLSADSRRLIAHGTLYKALSRMLDAGLLEAVWEESTIAAEAGRPRRRLYAVTPAGAAALSAVRSGERVAATFRPVTGGAA